MQKVPQNFLCRSMFTDEEWAKKLAGLPAGPSVVINYPIMAAAGDEDDPIQSLAYDPSRYPHCIEIDAR